MKSCKNQTYLLDATQRHIPPDTFQQEEFFSGKKKRHTLKNLLLLCLAGSIVFLALTRSGKWADKTIAQQELRIQKPIRL